ncbi:hypothetical protein J7F01_41055 [Streptomyces sp. ISL-22]|uniref:hypothetical protein n=1 Tax=unclassified Streptomyces TaxID=2593676 RepID=UPI001BECA965|nr:MULTISPECIES: hypothetical protein [unclassified Streptomyces]MBT2418372.1 hypothetical protein [Streptomyces sp. ISL-24]MBT2438381.1 hypothetical protein [Streptomyces sp. ISL-22]
MVVKARAQSGPLSWGTISEWLASGHALLKAARREWDGAARLAMIPLGRAFDAVRIPGAVVHAAAGSTDRSIVEARLAQYLNDGPVIHDPGFCRYYALVPPGTADAWRTSAAECLGEGTYLGVPRVDRIDPDERAPLASYWSVPIARPGILCNPDDVRQLVVLGGTLADEDES